MDLLLLLMTTIMMLMMVEAVPALVSWLVKNAEAIHFFHYSTTITASYLYVT
jgi:hypothetical protein